jgi:hypothetical protein
MSTLSGPFLRQRALSKTTGTVGLGVGVEWMSLKTPPRVVQQRMGCNNQTNVWPTEATSAAWTVAQGSTATHAAISTY